MYKLDLLRIIFGLPKYRKWCKFAKYLRTVSTMTYQTKTKK